MSTFIQIGTNDGNDAFLERVRNYHPDLVILIEPNKDWNDTIRRNYQGISNVIILNVAITEMTQDEVKLYLPKTDKNGIAENGYGYASNNYSILPMDDWGDNLVEMVVPGLSLMDLCGKYGIKCIDFLAIDTEGYDGQIIKSIDFNLVNIKELEYEDWSFPEEAFTRHGDKKKEYGVNGTILIDRILTQAGYVIEKSKVDSMNRIAKKL